MWERHLAAMKNVDSGHNNESALTKALWGFFCGSGFQPRLSWQ
jgi:hypothetical protein